MYKNSSVYMQTITLFAMFLLKSNKKRSIIKDASPMGLVYKL